MEIRYSAIWYLLASKSENTSTPSVPVVFGTNAFSEFSKVSPTDKIIRLQEYGSQARFPNRIIFQIEFVETMETVDVGMHIQRINR